MTRAVTPMLELVLAVATLALSLGSVMAGGPKYGGVLVAMAREDLTQGFALNETSTVSGIWPSMPCYSNLVLTATSP